MEFSLSDLIAQSKSVLQIAFVIFSAIIWLYKIFGNISDNDPIEEMINDTSSVRHPLMRDQVVDKRSQALCFHGVAADNDGLFQPDSNVTWQDEPDFREFDKDKPYMVKGTRDVTNVTDFLMGKKVVNKKPAVMPLP